MCDWRGGCGGKNFPSRVCLPLDACWHVCVDRWCSGLFCGERVWDDCDQVCFLSCMIVWCLCVVYIVWVVVGFELLCEFLRRCLVWGTCCCVGGLGFENTSSWSRRCWCLGCCGARVCGWLLCGWGGSIVWEIGELCVDLDDSRLGSFGDAGVAMVICWRAAFSASSGCCWWAMASSPVCWCWSSAASCCWW